MAGTELAELVDPALDSVAFLVALGVVGGRAAAGRAELARAGLLVILDWDDRLNLMFADPVRFGAAYARVSHGSAGPLAWTARAAGKRMEYISG